MMFREAVRRSLRSLLICGVALGAFLYVSILASSSFLTQTELPEILRNPPRAITAMSGGIVNYTTPDGWLQSSMAHPIALALLSVSAIAVASLAVAGELERGTLDFVLTRPISRSAYLLSHAGAAVVGVAVVHAVAAAGVLVAVATVKGADTLSLAAVGRALLGSWLLFSAFAALTLLASSRMSLRGRAIAAGASIVVGSFFANFVALLFDVMHWLRFASLFHYVRIGELLAGMSVVYLLVPLGTVAAATVAALTIFARRDLTR